MGDAATELAALPAPLRRSLDLAWEAHQSGNVGVGAVLTDAGGATVAEGRNRVVDSDAPEGHLRGTYLAHAEIDVLGQLPPGDHLDITLWTTLQPCLLCTAAAVLTKVGSIVFLGPDPLWDGIERLPELNAQTARRWPARTGPLEGPLAAFAQLLPTTWFLGTSPGGVSIASLEHSAPRSAAVLERLAPDIARWSALSLVEAIDEVIDDL